MATTTIEEDVRHRAYELYLKRGGKNGNDQEDWFKAEKEVKMQMKTQEKRDIKKPKLDY